MRDQIERIAFHEAGHAVMAMACGFVVTEMSADPSAVGMGYVAWNAPHPPNDQIRRASVLTIAAGMAADMVHWESHGSEDEGAEGYFNDRSNAEVHLRQLGQDGAFYAYAFTVVRFLRRPDVWGYVEFVAELLLKGGTVNGQDIIGRIAQQCPKVDDTVFASLDVALEAKRQGIIPT